MKNLCISPIVKSRGLCSLSIYDKEYSFLFQRFININNSEIKDKYFIENSNSNYFCFNALETMSVLNNNKIKFPFLYDVKILYSLKGNKFNNLIDLGLEELGHARMGKYIDISDKIKSHIRSYEITKININNFFDEDLYPISLIENLHRERASIIIDLYEKFDNEDIKIFYKKFFSVIENLYSISRNPLNIDFNSIKNKSGYYIDVVRQNQSKDGKLHLQFNPVGAKTGRLSFEKGSVNLYTMPKSVRKCIVASEDHQIVQFDFKSFQPRIAIFSTDNEDFKDRFRNVDDIYSVFEGGREKNKLPFLAWMYSLDPTENSEFYEKAFPICELRTKLFRQAKKENKLINNFGRVLNYSGEEENAVFQNYITSTEVDLILKLFILLNPIMNKRKSKILFLFHDAIICQIYKEEMKLIPSIKDFMESYHKSIFNSIFPVNVKIGNNFGELREFYEK